MARGDNNVYVGKDGQVYRRTAGGWEQYDAGQWSGGASRIDSSTVQDLNRDADLRSQGASRASEAQSWRNSGGSGSGGGSGFGGGVGGGGMRGGGGGRGGGRR